MSISKKGWMPNPFYCIHPTKLYESRCVSISVETNLLKRGGVKFPICLNLETFDPQKTP